MAAPLNSIGAGARQGAASGSNWDGMQAELMFRGGGRYMEKLTTREQQVSDRVILGLQNKLIARQLGISARTVEDHRATIFRKLEVHNAIELTRKVLLDA